MWSDGSGWVDSRSVRSCLDKEDLQRLNFSPTRAMPPHWCLESLGLEPWPSEEYTVVVWEPVSTSAGAFFLPRLSMTMVSL